MGVNLQYSLGSTDAQYTPVKGRNITPKTQAERESLTGSYQSNPRFILIT